MGSERFQSDYIEYLQNRNAELLNRLAKMREIYENKIFSKNLNQHYFISTLLDVLNVCTAVPEEINMLFDKMSEAMSVLINVLSRKSALIQLGEKISKLLNPTENGDLIDVQSGEENNNSKSGRKAGTVKVSPMINGHIISTEPRIYLNRVSGNNIPNRNDSHRLSPILEVSPDVTLDSSNINSHNFKDLRVTSEDLNLNHATYNYINQESPKGRFKGTKIWKKSLSSNKQTQNKKDTNFSQNNENIEKLGVGDIGQPQSSENDTDPMEGPSWLYSEDQGTTSSPKCYIDFRRRRHRYARIFDKSKDDIAYFKNEVLNTDSICENIPSGEPCDDCDEAMDLKNSSRENSGSVIETDEEYTPCNKKQDRLRKRREYDNEANFDSDTTQKRRSSRRVTNKKEKKDSDISDSSYEGDNEENYSGKYKSSWRSFKNNRSKSVIESELTKTLPRVTSGEPEFDCQETRISPKKNSEYLKPMSYDINFLIKDALGKKAHIPIEDCMKKREFSKKKARPSASRSESNTESPRMNLSNDKQITVTNADKNLIIQKQRSKRKAAPTNLAEPKLGTKLRRS